MALSYKSYGEEVFAIFAGAVRPAKVVGVNTNIRGVVVGKRLHFPTVDGSPVSTNVRKRDIFNDEEKAKQAFFLRSLEGEYSD